MGRLFTDDLTDETTEFASGSEEAGYRRTSPFAVACLIFGLLSLVGLATVQDVGARYYVALPAFGLLLGWRAFSAMRRYNESGKIPARVGLGACVLCLGAAFPLQRYLDWNEVPPGYKRIGYEILQAVEGTGPIPDTAKALDGQRVYIKGFVYPGRQTTGIKEFVLCRDNGSCCFGGRPKLNDMIQVTLKEPLSLDYDTTMRQLAGTFRVQPTAGGEGVGEVLYQLEADFLR